MNRAEKSGIDWGKLYQQVDKMKILVLGDEAFKAWETTFCSDLTRRINDAAQRELTRWGLASSGGSERVEAETRTTSKTKTIVAPVKYEEKHFKEVDRFVIKGLKQTAALDKVSQKYDFNREGFEKQYRTRHLNKQAKPPEK